MLKCVCTAVRLISTDEECVCLLETSVAFQSSDPRPCVCLIARAERVVLSDYRIKICRWGKPDRFFSITSASACQIKDALHLSYIRSAPSRICRPLFVFVKVLPSQDGAPRRRAVVCERWRRRAADVFVEWCWSVWDSSESLLLCVCVSWARPDAAFPCIFCADFDGSLRFCWMNLTC